jgi:hypothetical protein
VAENPSAPAPETPARLTLAVPAAPAVPIASRLLAVALAWLVPGLGHIFLKRYRRGLGFLVLVLAALWIGWSLEGNLPRPVPNSPLSYLATFAEIGVGLPYFFLRYGLHYEGNLVAPGFEYGSAFLLTAGLMNLLLILDAWDIASGKKE